MKCDDCGKEFDRILPLSGLEIWTCDREENWPVTKLHNKLQFALCVSLCPDCINALCDTLTNATKHIRHRYAYKYTNKEFTLMHKDLHNWWYLLDKLLHSIRFTPKELENMGRLRNEIARACVNALFLGTDLESEKDIKKYAESMTSTKSEIEAFEGKIQ